MSGGHVEAGSGQQGKTGAAEYQAGHKTGLQNGDAISAKVQTGVKGVDVKQGEIIDRKYYTGVEARPQEQVLGRQLSSLDFFADDIHQMSGLIEEPVRPS